MQTGRSPLRESGIMTAIRKLWRSLKKDEKLWMWANRLRTWLGKVWQWYWSKTKPLYNRRWEHQRAGKIKRNEPVQVVFLCENPTFWRSFETVVLSMKKDPRFQVTLVSLRYRERSPDGSCFYRPLDYSTVARKLGLDFLESYDRGRWRSLKRLKPDYVFYVHPYDEIRHWKYKVKLVSRYAKTCYIPYCIPFNDTGVEGLSLPFYNYLDYYFLESKCRMPYVRELLGNDSRLDENHLLCLGYPRFDFVYNTPQRNRGQTSFTILWMPRWETGSRTCHFFDYKDVLPQYVQENPGCHLIFRPHPYCFRNFLSTGEMSQEEVSKLKREYQQRPDLSLDENSDYTLSFAEADVLVADVTSLMQEFFVTEKPIIFCRKRKQRFTETMRRLTRGMYIVTDEQELRSILNTLRMGEDPLQERRRSLVRELIDDLDGRSGERIKEQIAQDFYGE